MRHIPLFIVNKQIGINQKGCNMARVQSNLRQEVEQKKIHFLFLFNIELSVRISASTAEQINQKIY